MHLFNRLSGTFSIFAAAMILFSCNNEQGNTVKKERVAKGNVSLGGMFRMNENEDFRNLYPHNITEVTSHRIAVQIYEGLVKFSQKDLSLIPSLAEKWEVNDSATVFTFHIRKGVKFHDDPCFPNGKGREITANDFKYCFDKLCESHASNAGFWVFKDRVTGANAYFESTRKNKPLPGGVSGVKIIGDYTLQVTLDYPFAGFINIIATPFAYVFPKEAVDKYGIDMRVKCVGTGPFKLKEVKEGEAVILTRNENYWDTDEFGNQLPYLDAIKVTFVKEKKSELLEFKKGNLDMIYQLPIEMIDEVVGDLQGAQGGSEYSKFNIQISSALNTQYYGFQHMGDVFNDKRVRQAFSYAIDREKIVDFTLQGEGIPGLYGFVPPSFKDYDAKSVKGYTYNADKARKLLAEAGYPNGSGFPKISLQLNAGGGNRTQVAQVIQSMLKQTLNINVQLEVIPFAQHLENVETGKSTFWRAGWFADYPDPENFLNLFYGPHVPATLNERSSLNTMRYKSEKFDSVFMLSLREIDPVKRAALYQQADQIAMDDAVVMVIFYEESYRLVQPYVRNFDINAMEFRDLKYTYMIPSEQVEKEYKQGSDGGSER